jgi:hypothetical protein
VLINNLFWRDLTQFLEYTIIHTNYIFKILKLFHKKYNIKVIKYPIFFRNNFFINENTRGT